MNSWEVPLNKCYDFLLRKTYFQQNRKKSLKCQKFQMSINISKWVKILFTFNLVNSKYLCKPNININ